MPTTLYQKVAEQIAQAIAKGLYPTDKRLPGTRVLAAQFSVSISTILQAQRLLEQQGVIHARPRSGYYINPRHTLETSSTNNQRKKHTDQSSDAPRLVSHQRLILNLIQASQQPNVLQLGAAVPHTSFMPAIDIRKSIHNCIRQNHGIDAMMTYAFPPGDELLRCQIANRMLLAGINIEANELVVTNGCHEALILSLQAVTQKGDVVAVESPTYYGLLQIIEHLGLKAIEIPTDNILGLSIDALQLAIEQWPVKACVLVSNFSNPLGCSLSDHSKQRLVKTLSQAEIPLIENDVYGDLSFDDHRPLAAKHFDKTGWVMYCSSFSKSLAPGLRVGWLAPGRWYEKILYKKFAASLAAPTIPQHALANYLVQGRYDKHLRRIRRLYATNIRLATEHILNTFPAGTAVSLPKGGFVIWVELPSVDTRSLYQQGLKQGVSFAPGDVFSVQEKYNNCLRLNCALPWDAQLKQGIDVIAGLLRC